MTSSIIIFQLTRVLICTALLMVVVIGCGYMFIDYIDRPYKLVSYSTKQCVAIQNADGTTLPCSEEDKNKKYIWVWVK